MPRGTTFVSPATIGTPASAAAAAIAATCSLSMSAGRPSSRISDSVSAIGLAPAIAMSLIVPLTASSPIVPPGKTIGLTTKQSVVIAMWPPSTATVPASAIASSVSLANAGTSRPSMRLCVALPPAPCAIVICVSRNF